MPIIKEVEKLEKIEHPPQPTHHGHSFMKIHKFTKEIPLPSFPHVKELFHHEHETPSEAPVESEAPEHQAHQMSW